MKTIKHFMGNTFNIGDYIISDSIDKLLYEYIKKDFEIIKINVTSGGLWQNFKGITDETMNFIKKPDLVIIGGHPLIGRKGMLDIKTNINFQETPFFMMAVGSLIKLNEENMEPGYVDYMEQYLPYFKAVSTRDKESYEFIKKFNSNTFLTGCSGLFLYEKEFKYNDSDYIIVSFNGEELSLKFYEALLFNLKKLGLKIFLIVHDIRETQQASSLAKKCGCYFLSSLDYKFYVPFMENSKFVISFRLHGAILASTLGVPFMTISFDTRGKDFEDMFDKGSLFTIRSKEGSHAKVRKIFFDKVKGRIKDNLKRFKMKLSKNEKDLIEKIMDKAEKITKKQIDYSDYFNNVELRKQEMLRFIGYIDKYI